MKTKNNAFRPAAALTVLAAIPLWALAPGISSKKCRAPFLHRNFAHRGLHTEEQSVPENSLKAFRLAAESGYGVELDVHITKDGEIVVFHDDTLDRVCGVSAQIEDMNLSELEALSLCGTEEKIPLFTDVLDVIAGRGPIICEVKGGKRNRELCEKVLSIIRNYEGDICIESFNPFIVAWFRFHAPDIFRGLLAMPAENYEGILPKPAAYILSSGLFNFVCRPQFMAYMIGKMPLPARLSCMMGAVNVGWTSHSVENEKGRDAVIFEYYLPNRYM